MQMSLLAFALELEEEDSMRSFVKVALLAAALAIVAIAPAQKARYQMTIQEVTNNTGFAVQSFSWGVSNPVTIGAGGPGVGRASVSSFNIMKTFDSYSAQLANMCFMGSHAATARVRGYLGDSTVPFIEIILTNVYVESAQLSGSTGVMLTESDSFAFSAMSLNGVVFNLVDQASVMSANEMLASIIEKASKPSKKSKVTVH